MLLNFNEEIIPDTNTLYREAMATINAGLQNDKYYFNQLFTEKNGYYETNFQLFDQMGIYNTLNPKTKKPAKEIQGLYIFYEGGAAKYAGISRKILNRLRNHFIGKDHFQASLVYLMARAEEDKKGLFMKRRKDLEFHPYREQIQPLMREKWQIQIIPETDSFKRALLEILVACELKTQWNSFETH